MAFNFKYNSILILTLSLLVVIGGKSVYGKAVRTEQGWVLRQSSNFAGLVSSDLTNNALKMRIGKLGITIITKAPQWNALIYNANSKTFVDLPYKRWQKQFTLNTGSGSKDPNAKSILFARNTGKTMTISRFKTYECIVLRKSESNKNIAEEKVSQLWIASDIKAPTQIAQIFCSHLGMPIQKGIPLKASRYINGKTTSVLDTLSADRQVISASSFEPLPGYKKVKDEIELFMSESKDMEDLLDVPSVKIDKKK